MQQAPSPRDGLRKTRWLVARNTFPELKRTTLPTWRQVWPPALYGEVKMGSPPRHEIAFGDVRIQVDFLALDDEEDINKLRSAEYTGACVHECQYASLELFREIRSRTNRPMMPNETIPTLLPCAPGTGKRRNVSRPFFATAI